jgi:hypothetical protein
MMTKEQFQQFCRDAVDIVSRLDNPEFRTARTSTETDIAQHDPELAKLYAENRHTLFAISDHIKRRMSER